MIKSTFTLLWQSLVYMKREVVSTAVNEYSSFRNVGAGLSWESAHCPWERRIHWCGDSEWKRWPKAWTNVPKKFEICCLSGPTEWIGVHDPSGEDARGELREEEGLLSGKVWSPVEDGPKRSSMNWSESITDKGWPVNAWVGRVGDGAWKEASIGRYSKEMRLVYVVVVWNQASVNKINYYLITFNVS